MTRINMLTFAIREEHATTQEAEELRTTLTRVSKGEEEMSTQEFLFQYSRLESMEVKLDTLRGHIARLTEEVV